MKLSNDISKEELAVFLEETDEELKLLDEDLVLMEKSGVKPQIIQEIFRAAHTLKGSSAMLGYDKMSKTAHAMEAVLDLLRSGKLDISTSMINALLSGLDVLKVLREQLVADDEEECPIDITEVTSVLEQIASGNNKEGAVTNKKCLNISDEAQHKIDNARNQGLNVFSVDAVMDKKSSWLAVRLFQLYSELTQMGDILTCSPSREEIESGKASSDLALILASGRDPNGIKTILNTVQDVVKIEIVPLKAASTASPDNLSKEVPPGAAVTDVKTPSGEQAKQSEVSPVAKAENAGQTPKKNAQTSETVRVDVKLLDNLMNLVGEMVIDRNRIKQISRKLEKKYEGDDVVDSLTETSTHMVKLVSDLQENILRARMQGIGTILNGFPRLVRDLAQKAGKKIDFYIEGQETELDRSIIEQIRDPLLHLLRNSVDHGIEMPAVRQKAGKVETGTIRLAAYHEQSHIVVSISDDGGGIDVEKVKKAAISKGFMSTEAVERLSQQEAQSLIFMNGVSTAEKVTEVSGRGVGMDVVKTNVSNVGGSISVESKLGHGTTIKIRLPLTLATIDGILISSGGLIYVVPISAIVEILKIKSDQVQGVMGREVIRLRENVIPLIRLHDRFSSDNVQNQLAAEFNVMVIKVGDKLSGLIVDQVLEPQESVVKSLGKFIGSLRGISGATIMGDGQVALILDTATLVKESN
jgi:two-component system, chemotaxis family, sensor kinase CheA